MSNIRAARAEQNRTLREVIQHIQAETDWKTWTLKHENETEHK